MYLKVYFLKNVQLNQQQPSVSQVRDRDLRGSKINLYLSVNYDLI